MLDDKKEEEVVIKKKIKNEKQRKEGEEGRINFLNKSIVSKEAILLMGSKT